MKRFIVLAALLAACGTEPLAHDTSDDGLYFMKATFVSDTINAESKAGEHEYLTMTIQEQGIESVVRLSLPGYEVHFKNPNTNQIYDIDTGLPCSEWSIYDWWYTFEIDLCGVVEDGEARLFSTIDGYWVGEYFGSLVMLLDGQRTWFGVSPGDGHGN